MSHRLQTRVTIERATVGYGAQAVLRDFSIEIAPGELVSLLGPSGCGKTTALKLIAGLLEPVAGDVRFDGDSVLNVEPERREAVMVFQKPLLFPYLTVEENIAFGLKMRHTPVNQIRERVKTMLRMLQLDGYQTRRPHQLSGGQEQRVALARALVTEPRILLLDEPFSALDENLRAEMRRLIRELQRELGMTTVFVTHDQVEAATVADRIALLLDGAVEQIGSPREFYTRPATLKSAGFFGWQTVTTGTGEARKITAFRPERAQLLPRNGRQPKDEELMGAVVFVSDLGSRLRYRIALDDCSIVEVEQDSSMQAASFSPGAQVLIRIDPQTMVEFQATNTLSISS